MVLQFLSNFATITFTIVSFIQFSAGSMIEQFFRWLRLGIAYDIVASSYAPLSAFLFTLIMLKWVRDPRWLGAIFILFFLF